MKTVLITAIGSFSADAAIKSLKKLGLRVLGCDIFPKEWVVDAYSVDEFFQVPRGTDQEAYIEAIQTICAKYLVDYLIPLTDVEIDALNENRKWFEQNGVQLCMSSKITIDICRDKFRTYRVLKNQLSTVHSIPTFPAVKYKEKQSLEFPMVCKPYNGRSSQGMKRVFSKQELESYLETVNPENFIIQPLIAGSVITVDIVRNSNTNSIVCVPRRELLRTLSGAGTSVFVFHDDKLAEECKTIAEALNIHGCVNFEFVQSQNGDYYFLECNPRFSGGIKFSCMIGYDFVMAHLNCFSQKEIDKLEPYQNCYIARKYEETITSIG